MYPRYSTCSILGLGLTFKKDETSLAVYEYDALRFQGRTREIFQITDKTFRDLTVFLPYFLFVNAISRHLAKQ